MNFVYTFGFESPRELRANKKHSWDDESSCSFIIDAPSEDVALAWGREVAEVFFGRLHGDPSMSWRSHNYADAVRVLDNADSRKMQFVRIGEFPDLDAWCGLHRE
jgi:hypothetical protein